MRAVTRCHQPKVPKEPGSRSGRITVVVQDRPANHAPGTTLEGDEIGIVVNMNLLNFYEFDGAFFRNLLKVSTISHSFFGGEKKQMVGNL